MRAYSIDLRERIVAAVESGTPREEVAQTFRVSRSTIKRWLARRRADATDDLTPRVSPGRPRAIVPTDHAALWAQLEAHRDASIAAHARLWNAGQGTTVSRWAIGRAIRRLGWTYKKRHWVPPSGTRRFAGSIASGWRL
jgi:transposase